MPRVLLVDGKNAMYRVEYMRSGADIVHSFLRQLSSVLELCPGVPVVVWERTIPGKGKPTPNWRNLTESCYDYKGQRKETHHSRFVARAMPFVASFLEYAGIVQTACPYLEADDLIALLVGQFRKMEWQVAIASNDRDYYQLVGEGVLLVRPSRSGWQIYDYERVKLETGVAPEYWAKVKAVAGDVSDHIRPIKGLGEATSRQYVLVYGLDPSVPSFRRLPDEVKVRFSAYRAIWSRFHHAYRLIYLPTEIRDVKYPGNVKRLARAEVGRVVSDVVSRDAGSVDNLRERVLEFYRDKPGKVRDLSGLLRRRSL